MAGYDIFISYRRDTGAPYARILQLMLQQRGYKVFLDYDELKDGAFGKNIQKAIIGAPVFLLVLSKNSMDRCLNEDDWVRQEIMLAIGHNKHVIPVNPDKSFNGFPEDCPDKKIPQLLKDVVMGYQHSDIDFGQTLGVTLDFMVTNRLVPTLGVRTPLPNVDQDFATAQQTLRKQDAHNRFVRRITVTGVSVVVLLISLTCALVLRNIKKEQQVRLRQELVDRTRVGLEENYKNFNLRFSSEATLEQMGIVDTILSNMKQVRQDSLWISKYEFRAGEWYGLQALPYDILQKFYPITNVSYGEIYMFLLKLRNLSGLDGRKGFKFDLPTADEWEYAARGGEYCEPLIYAGSNNIDAVAWYEGNSGSKVHMSDGLQRKEPNRLDLYDMSGNVSEICNTAYDVKDEGSRWTVCGGNFNSAANQVCVDSRAPVDINAKEPTIGFRLVIRRE